MSVFDREEIERRAAGMDEVERTMFEALMEEIERAGVENLDATRLMAAPLVAMTSLVRKVEARAEQAGPKAVREFVEWLSHQRAYNGAPHAGQAFHDYGLNMLLPQWAEEFLAGEDMPPSRDCIATTTCTRYGECRALTPCKTTRDVEDKPYRSQWGREDGLD